MAIGNPMRIELSRRTRDYLARAKVEFSRASIYRKLAPVLSREATKAASYSVAQYMSGQRLKVRTGALRRSVVGRFELYNGKLAVRIGNIGGVQNPYAAVQEYGTKGENPDSPIPTIVPKRARALAMPVGPSLTPAGVRRYQSPREVPEPLRFVPRTGSNKSNVIGLLVTTPKGATGEIAYLLLSQVDLKPRYYLRDGLKSSFPSISKAVGDTLKTILTAEGS